MASTDGSPSKTAAVKKPASTEANAGGRSAARNGHGNAPPAYDDACREEGAEVKKVEPDFSSNSLHNSEGEGDTKAVTNLLPVPPDGGYGWVICIAAFMCNFVVDGIANSFGPFMTPYGEYFHSSKSLVSLIGSLLIACYLFIGPFVGGMVNRYGARIVVIAGSILSGICFVISTFTTNIYVFMLFYGFLGGAAFGLIYLPAIVCVSFYFEKKRSMATGIAVAGSGAGTIVLPPLCLRLIKSFGWRTAVYALAGISFGCAIFGAMYKPLKAPEISEDEKEEMLKEADVEMRPVSNLSSGANESPSKHTDSDGKARSAEQDEDRRERARGSVPNAGGATRARKLTATSVGSDGEELKQSKQNLTNLGRISARDYAQSITRLSQSQQLKGSQVSINSGVDPKEFARPLNRRDIFYQGSIKNLPEFIDEGRDYRQYRESQISIPAAVAAQAIAGEGGATGEASRVARLSRAGALTPEEEQLLEHVDDSKCKCIPLSIRSAFGEMIDTELLKEPVMMLLCLSNLFAMIGFYVPFMFIIDMAVLKNITQEDGALLLSVIGITNTIGRVVFGWVSDRGWVSALNINNFSLITCGILTIICPMLPNFGTLLIYAIFFGFIISAYICLTSIVLADLLGLERLTNSFGLLVVSRGIACLIGTPIAGKMYDITQSYDVSFYFGGVLIIFAGLASTSILYVQYLDRKKKLAAERENLGDDRQNGGISQTGAKKDDAEKLTEGVRLK